MVRDRTPDNFPMSQRRLPALLGLASAWLFTSCVSWTTPPHTAISSTPPGARVVIDGTNSGHLTPCLVKLDNGRDHRVRLELEGYQIEEVLLRENGDLYLIPWEEGVDGPYGWSFPLFLDATDLFAPVRIDDGLSPDRIHLELDPLDGPR